MTNRLVLIAVVLFAFSGLTAGEPEKHGKDPGPPPLALKGPKPEPVSTPEPKEINRAMGRGIRFLIENQEKRGKQAEGDQCSSAAERFPLLQERPGKVRVATRYARLLAQMDSILENMDPVQTADVAYDPYDLSAGFMWSNGTKPAVAGIAVSSPIEEMMRERMVMIEDELEYASSQVGIPVDLLAAVTWAECKMLPYAINVQGKAYHFTSRERALRMLRRIETDDVDIGLFQVNYRLWGEPLGLQKEDLLNSRVCAIMGALILRYNLQRHRDPWVAIGRYHSGNMDRMRAYQAKVSRGLIIIRTILSSPQGKRPEFSEIIWKEHRDPVLHSEERLDS